jgi:hypothetical protein
MVIPDFFGGGSNPFLGVGTPSSPWPSGPGLETWPGWPQLPGIGLTPSNPSTPTTPTTPSENTSSLIGGLSGVIACFQNPAACLLRIVLLILGFICVIGAIYLFKPTQEIVSGPVRAAINR